VTDLRFGWHAPSFPVDGSQRTAFIDQIINTLGKIESTFDSVWVDDHFIPWAQFQSDDTDYLECMTTIAYLAGMFHQIDFGASVLCQSYRNPALLAKMSANLQLFTRGRYLFGIGAGWKENEYHAYNYEFPRASVRIAQMEETIEIARRMWTETPASYEGTYYRIDNAYCEPQPDPVPPILIGGGGEQLTLRVVAKHADMWNIPGGTLENYKHKLNVLRSHCEAVGRDYDEIVKTWSAEVVALGETEAEAQRILEATPYSQPDPIVGTPQQVAAQLQQFVDAGVSYLIVRLVDFPKTAGIELFMAEVMPRLRGAA